MVLYRFIPLFRPAFYENMFLLVSMSTGGRHIQTRLIEPKTSLMNSGDVFVLVTNKYVHQWNGKNCSIMEKARVCRFYSIAGRERAGDK